MFIYIFGALVAYFATSFFFLKNPLLMKKKKTWKSELMNKALGKEILLHCAHRGGSRIKVENTIESFENGLKEGTNILEMDVCLTKDKQIIVIHDSNLKRMCGVDRNVEEFNYKDLPKFLDEFKLDFSVGGKMSTKDCKTLYFPTLEEVFTKFPGVLVNIEIKTPTEEFLQLMNKIIIKYNREDSVIWGCKNQIMSKRLKEINPNVRRFFSLGGLQNLLLHYILGTLPYMEIDEDSLQIPIYNKEHHQWKIQEHHGFMQQFQVFLYFLVIKLLSKVSQPLFEHLRQRGIMVILWVMNNRENFDDCLKYNGCVGIMTDRPQFLTDYLKEKKMYLKT